MKQVEYINSQTVL